MEPNFLDSAYSESLKSIICGKFSNEDIVIVKRGINKMVKEEGKILKEMDKEKNKYSRYKEKRGREIKEINKSIREAKRIIEGI